MDALMNNIVGKALPGIPGGSFTRARLQNAYPTVHPAVLGLHTKKKAARIPDSTTLTPTDTCSLQLADAHSSVRMCQKACAISMNKLKYHLRTRLNAGVAKEDLVRRRLESCDSSSSCFTKAVVVLIAVILHEDQQ